MPKRNPQYAQLRARMVLMGYTGKDLAEEVGISKQGMCYRLSAKVDWTVPEAMRICEALEIPPSEIPKYFPPGGMPA